MESGEFNVLVVCFEAEDDDVYCTLSGRVFSFWWAEPPIGGEMDEGHWDFGVRKFAVLCYFASATSGPYWVVMLKGS